MQKARAGERDRGEGQGSVQKSQRGRLPFCVYRNCNTDETPTPTLTLEPMPTLSLLIDKRRQYIWTYICIFRSQILRNDDERQRWWCCPDDHSLLTPLDDFVAVLAFRLWLPFPYCNIDIVPAPSFSSLGSFRAVSRSDNCYYCSSVMPTIK